MGLKRQKGNNTAPKKNGYKWKKGTFMARLVRVYELGLQPQTDWQTKEPKAPEDRLMFTFEFPACTFPIEKEGETVMLPALLSTQVNLSFHEKSNLTKLLDALDPSGEIDDIEDMLGNAVMVNVGFTASNNAKIEGVTACPDGIEVGALVNDTGYFSMATPDKKLFDALPKWVQELILGALDLSDDTKALLSVGENQEPSPEGVDDPAF